MRIPFCSSDGTLPHVICSRTEYLTAVTAVAGLTVEPVSIDYTSLLPVIYDGKQLQCREWHPTSVRHLKEQCGRECHFVPLSPELQSSALGQTL